MALKKIREVTQVVPNSGDRILIEQNGAGRSAALSPLPVSDPTMEALNDVRKDITKVYKFKGAVIQGALTQEECDQIRNEEKNPSN